MPRIILEGQIASMKSSLLTLLEKDGYDVVREPTLTWCNFHGKDMLERLYVDPSTNFEFHILAYTTYLQVWENAPSDKITYYERSIHSAHNVFIPYAHSQGHITCTQKHLLDEIYLTFMQKINLEPEYYFFLECTPKTALARVQKRNRAGEAAIDLARLTLLQEYHNAWKAHLTNAFALNAERDLKELHQECKELTHKLFSQRHDATDHH